MIERPGPDEYVSFFARYVERASGTDALVLLRSQLETTGALFGALAESQGDHTYATGKWTIRQIIGHLADVERIMAYRALRIARADATPLPGFEENDYVDAAGFESRTVAALAEEWRLARRGTIALFEGLAPGAAARRGVVSNGPISARALGYILAGHERHHLAVLHDRYGIGTG